MIKYINNKSKLATSNFDLFVNFEETVNKHPYGTYLLNEWGPWFLVDIIGGCLYFLRTKHT